MYVVSDLLAVAGGVLTAAGLGLLLVVAAAAVAAALLTFVPRLAWRPRRRPRHAKTT